MNIYIEIEILKRELKGKLLIALELIKSNNQVYISDRSTITRLAIAKKIQPGIIFLKDMNSTKGRIADYKKIIKNNFKIVSQDEEIGCFKDNSFEFFFKERFRTKNIFKYIDKYFCWGNFDYSFLKRYNLKTKFYKAGSARIDIAKNVDLKGGNFLKKKYNLRKNNILISLNHTLFWKRHFIDRLIADSDNDKTDPEKVIYRMDRVYRTESQHYILFFKLFRLIVKLDKLNNFSIIVRPHPAMDEEKVKSLFNFTKFLKNVKIVGDQELIDQINISDYVIHTGCTSGIEGTLNKKNVINFLPKNKNLKDYTNRGFLSKIGKTFDDENKVFNYIKKNSNKNYKQKKIINYDTKKISERILVDSISYKRVAFEINSINIKNYNSTKKNSNYNFFELIPFIKIKIKKLLGYKNLKNKSLNAFEVKFPPFNKVQIINDLDGLKKGFGINSNYKLELINNRVLKISKN